MEIVKDVVCPFCGCLCDDGEVMVENGDVTGTKNLCRIGHAKFMHSAHKSSRHLDPLIRQENGELKKVDMDTAIEESARILVEANWPILYGWSATLCESQQKGIELTELVGGVFDNTAAVCHGPSLLAVQDRGYPTCSLDEAKNYADLVFYWGCNPVHAHPRHMSRYSIHARGFFREKGIHDRTMIVVDPRKTDSAKMADIHIQPYPGTDHILISALRMILNGVEPQQDVIAGVPKEQLYELVDIVGKHQFSVVFFGMGLTQSRGKHRNIDNAITLIADLNKHIKSVLVPMRGHYNVAGCNIVAAYETGYPFCVDFSKGYPTYNPGESSTIDMLTSESADAMLVCGADPGHSFPNKAVASMAKIPVVNINPVINPTDPVCDIIIPCAFSGVEHAGTGYRMDCMPMRLKEVVSPPEGIISDTEILKKIILNVKQML
ncbi:formylmethanofuran dehydrogenase subunit B [Methanococcus aeolicus]|uniref:formylmethanofuran dehydrogenase subunit B n=1 Tax=Methanococcus aeolicus TaxID=42879 RepID=UPI0021C5FA03|nr:formylmethanofuran dehydrogenase subunit B [Methanococcus aeolicus]UXM85188.1 formylmethanofuran dehydrogenase subunit B [Methanococcus aeolicus]